ncbi:MAG: hopanoid biosynthesis associated radical SAM protein HpnH [Planctomycetes bacterium RBG_16_64_10]|nr:MAG: hopanoid biosynthesis associated radical SAM protein HpnH [Planctomycetes bacterium RBG_16_64_10]
MGVPVSQVAVVASHVLGQKLRGRQRFPLVLMLEPLFRCNLTCAGCGKIQHPAALLRRQLSPEQCLRAVDECGAPIVSLAGGEPLLHPQIGALVAAIVARKKYVYLCTNAVKLRASLQQFQPSEYLTFSVHLDGLRETHDRVVGRAGVFDRAVEAARAALRAGFRVTSNTTLFDGADPAAVRQLFEQLMDLGVEGMTISPAYHYATAPDQDHFLLRDRTEQLMRRVLDRPKRHWRFNQSPLFLEFLQGKTTLECTPWGSPTYNLFGWQQPCYLLGEGSVGSFRQWIDETPWDQYGHRSGNPRCRDCMVHCGHEPTAVIRTFGSLKGLLTTVRLVGWKSGSPRRDRPGCEVSA